MELEVIFFSMELQSYALYLSLSACQPSPPRSRYSIIQHHKTGQKEGVQTFSARSVPVVKYAIDAVRSGAISYRVAAATYSYDVLLLYDV